MYTIYARRAHKMSAMRWPPSCFCTRYARNMRTICTQCVCNHGVLCTQMYTICTHYAQSKWFACMCSVHNTYTMCAHYEHNTWVIFMCSVHTMYKTCTPCVHSVLVTFMSYVHITYTICLQYVHSVRVTFMCSAHSIKRYVRNVYTRRGSALCVMYTACKHSAHNTHTVCL